jgi:hypothetical protein
MRVIKEEDKTERQKILFKIADEMYDKVFEFSMDYMDKIKEHPVFEEMQDFEVISFFANVYTKVFCQGFCTMIKIKSDKMREHESTTQELLDEWVEGIYVFLNQKKEIRENVKGLPDGIKGIKIK